MTVTFAPDRSQWNGVTPVASFGAVMILRIDTGFDIDPDWVQNYANAKTAHAAGTLQLLIVYLVHKTGAERVQAARVLAALGGACPGWVRFEVDEESGTEFDGPGDHSAGANLLVTLLGGFTGVGVVGVMGYANSPDWQSNWASRVAGLKRNIADYSDVPPAGSWYAWQYWGGVQNPAPAGYPAPSGEDMNAFPYPIDQILEDFGVLMADATLSAATIAAVAAASAGAVAKLFGLSPSQQQNVFNEAAVTVQDLVALAKSETADTAAMQAGILKLEQQLAGMTGDVDAQTLAAAIVAEMGTMLTSAAK